MTTPDRSASPVRGALLDVLALCLIVGGLVGLGSVALYVHPLLGVSFLSFGALAAGYLLAFRNVSEE